MQLRNHVGCAADLEGPHRLQVLAFQRERGRSAARAPRHDVLLRGKRSQRVRGDIEDWRADDDVADALCGGADVVERNESRVNCQPPTPNSQLPIGISQGVNGASKPPYLGVGSWKLEVGSSRFIFAADARTVHWRGRP